MVAVAKKHPVGLDTQNTQHKPTLILVSAPIKPLFYNDIHSARFFYKKRLSPAGQNQAVSS